MSWLNTFLKRKSPLTEPSTESKDVELREGTAELDEFIARAELDKGDNLAHGANHLANLLNFDPGNREWMALFDQYLNRANGNLETLIPRGDKLYAASEAMRALLWQRQGRLAEAVALIVQVTSATHPKYLQEWALGWVEADGAIESLPKDNALHLLALALNSMPEARLATVAQVRQARRWAAVTERALQRADADGMTTMLRAGILRKAGRFDDALAVVRPALDAAPDWNKAVALGLILRQKGDLAAASDAFEAAQRIDPDVMATYLEGGDTFFEVERWNEARSWYRRALAKDPAQEWAKPSDLFCEWKLTGDQAFFDRVVELAKAGNGRANNLWSAAFDQPHEPQDATANILRQALDGIAKNAADGGAGGGGGGSINIDVSSLEAPSNGLAFALAMAAKGLDLTVKSRAAAIPEPDPRQPIDAVRYKLWEYQGTDAKPGLPPPSERVRQAIAELAQGAFDRQLSFARASRVAEQLGPQALPDILATMVHPPALPPARDALEFVPRVQLEAMHVAAQVDDGWQGSQRRTALMSVLFGPMDWTTNAAIDALAFLAERNPAYAYDIHKSFQFLEQNRPTSGYCCWRNNLYHRWLSLPLLYDNEREEIRKKLFEQE
jgi:tetratricopeptide (TPR) repeat protein